jgi:hypothetical protein
MHPPIWGFGAKGENIMIRKALAAVAVSALLATLGCRSAPLYNVSSSPVSAPKPVTIDDVERAITRAGAGLGWQIVSRAPGKMEGVLALRAHRAVVDITYDTKTYSIKYKDSSNLDYDGTNIHSNYNGWIQNLDKAIRTQLSLL